MYSPPLTPIPNSMSRQGKITSYPLDTYANLPQKLRKVFLQQLVQQANLHELQYLATLLMPKLKTDMIAMLPVEVSLQILSYLAPETLCILARVSKTYNALTNHITLWQRICREHKVPMGGLTKSAYRLHYLTNIAWEQEAPRVTTFLAPNSGVITSMQSDQHRIAAGLDVRGVGVIHILKKDGTWVRTLLGHQGGVWCLQFIDDTLVSGGCDRDIRVWDMKTGVCRFRLQGHTSTVRCLQMSSINGRPVVVSGSRDATMRVWCLETGECIHTLMGHTGSVRCLAIFGNKIVSGSYDGTARLWDLVTGECIFVLHGHTAQVYSIAFYGEYICTGALDNTVHIWSPTTGECTAVLQGHDALVGHLQLDGNMLVTGGSDGRVCIWDLETLNCRHKLHTHSTAVTSLYLDGASGRLITGGDDGVKVWDVHAGRHVRTICVGVTSVWKVDCDARRLIVAVQRDEGTLVETLDFGMDDLHEEEMNETPEHFKRYNEMNRRISVVGGAILPGAFVTEDDGEDDDEYEHDFEHEYDMDVEE